MKTKSNEIAEERFTPHGQSPAGAAKSLEVTRRAFLGHAATAGLILSVGPKRFLGKPSSIIEQEMGLMEKTFLAPPDDAKPWTYWWWLDGAVSKEGITRDLEEMRAKGIAGVLIFDAGTGGSDSPKGPAFMSDEWRENFRYAVQEAGRLGIGIGINLCSGWDAGGPCVEREDSIKAFVWSETSVEGPARLHECLSLPELQKIKESASRYAKGPEDWYRDISVMACLLGENGIWDLRKALDLTALTSEGTLRWMVPEGKWVILRLGYRMTQARTKVTASEQLGWEIDPLSAQAMDRHFARTGAVLIHDAGSLAGQTLKYTHIDSWEIGQPTWTAKFVEEFQNHRGYDPIPYLPALANKIVGNDILTERFLWDYRRTLADLVAKNYYGRLTALSNNHGLGTHSEAGGPSFSHDIDGLECLGADDIPMGEFWSNRFVGLRDAPSPTEEVASPFFKSTEWRPVSCDGNTGSVRQAVSCAHTYGKALAQAEAYTNYNDDWTEDPYFLKPYGDRAFCLGLTRQMLCFYVHQSELNTPPGYQWEHVGTHFDRNITWWEKSHAWLTYLARCQYMLRHGRFVADVLYFCGEVIPNFVLIDRKPVPGFDFDSINAEALLRHSEVKNRDVILSNGITYRYLVIPEGVESAMSLAVLQRINDLVERGATLVGVPPERTPGLKDYPRCDEDLKRLSDGLWGSDRAASGTRKVGNGRVIWGYPLEDIIKADRLLPDLELRGVRQDAQLDWIHRRSKDADIYFLANGSEIVVDFEAAFRVEYKVPEVWDPVTGEISELPQFQESQKQTVVPMRLEPYQSLFVVFRKMSADRRITRSTNFPDLDELATLTGPWEIAFDPTWGGPEKVIFEHLEDWSKRPEEGIRYYSGTATYRKTFDLPRSVIEPLFLDFGEVKNLAQVRLNGKDLGVVWTAPWRVAISDVVREKGNRLVIEVVNLWPNRLIGDGKLPKNQRRTVTNVHTYDAVLPNGFDDFGCPVCEDRKKTGKEPELLSSGLLGPVRILRHV